jgi:aromatic ring-cleaving dioxygenase
MEYQAHVYWTDDDGYRLASDMKKILISLGCRIGPDNLERHPQSYWITYHSRVKKVVERYIRNNHAKLSILIHEKSTDEQQNVVLDPKWIGNPIV